MRFSRRLARVAVSVPAAACSVLVFLPSVSSASSPDYASDPVYAELAVASVRTAALGAEGMTLEASSRMSDSWGSREFSGAYGFDAQSGEASSLTVSSWEGGVVPQGLLPASVVSSSAASVSSARRDERISPPVPRTAKVWFGSSPALGDFDWLDRAALGPVERAALRNLGVAGASFLVSPSSFGHYEEVRSVVQRESPAGVLGSVTALVESGEASFGPFSASDVAEGRLVAFEVVSTPLSGSPVTYSYEALLSDDGVIRSFAVSFAGPIVSVDSTVSVVGFSPESPVVNMVPEGALVADRAAFEAEVGLLYALSAARSAGRYAAAEAGEVAALAGVAVSPGIIQRVAERELSGSYEVSNSRRGVVFVDPAYESRFACSIRVRVRSGERVAASSCVRFPPLEIPAPVRPRA